jgi:hypothetical protein
MTTRTTGTRTQFALVILLAGASAAYAADSNKKERCTKYAQRAVEQYQLMQSHPQCRVSDDMNWHNNLDGHYNGCMLIPEFMARAGEAGRDNHLQACGAFADTTVAPKTTAATSDPGQNPGSPTATTTPGGGAPLPVATGSTSGGNSPGTSVAATQRVRANDTAGNPDQCQPPPAPASLIRGSFAGSGQTPRISGDTLSFHDQRKQGALSSFKVQRPAFWNTYMRCLKKADANKADMPVMGLMGPWVWISENHQEASFFNVAGGAISIWSIPPSVGADLLKN